MSVLFSQKEIFARKAGYLPGELVNFRETEDGGAVAIIPTGQKIKYTAEELHAIELVMETEGAPARAKPVTKKGSGRSATRPIKK
jgi:hypothetical protein